MKDYSKMEEYKEYRENFINIFGPVYRSAVIKSSVKPMADLRLCEEVGCIFQNKHYEMNDNYFLQDNRSNILEVLRKLKIYKSNRGGWGSLPVASLLSGNAETKQQELFLADAFLTILESAELGESDDRVNVNNLDFFIIYDPLPGKKLLERPADLNQFIVMPERLDKNWSD